MSELVIETEGLRRTFGKKEDVVEAVAGVDLRVEAGTIFGFLGPNGAGKTTTLRILATLLLPTAGTARVAGHDVARDPEAVRRRIGYVAQSGGTDPRMSGRGELVMQGRLFGLPGAAAHARAAELLEALDLADAGDRPIETYSGGMRRRLDVGLGMVHRPVAAVPRRADDRAGPAGASPDVGRDPRPPGRRHHRVPDDPLPRRGGRAVRPPGHHRPRPDRRERDRARAQAGRRRRRHHDRRRLVRGARLPAARRPAVRARGEPRRRRRAALRRGRRGEPARSCSGCSTARASPRRRSRSTGPASTTSSCARPGARCATPPEPPCPDTGSERTHPVRVFHDTWLVFRRSLGLTVRQPAWLIAGRHAAVRLPAAVRPAPEQPVLHAWVPARRRVQHLRPGPARDDGAVRFDVRRLRLHQRDALRRHRADAGHADEPHRGRARAHAAGRPRVHVPGHGPGGAVDPARAPHRPGWASWSPSPCSR